MSQYDAIHEGLWDMDDVHPSGLTWAETSWEMDQESLAFEDDYIVRALVRQREVDRRFDGIITNLSTILSNR